jgi:hypothetical protein
LAFARDALVRLVDAPKAWRKFEHQWIGPNEDLRKKKIVLSDVVRLAEMPPASLYASMWQPLISGVP